MRKVDSSLSDIRTNRRWAKQEGTESALSREELGCHLLIVFLEEKLRIIWFAFFVLVAPDELIMLRENNVYFAQTNTRLQPVATPLDSDFRRCSNNYHDLSKKVDLIRVTSEHPHHWPCKMSRIFITPIFFIANLRFGCNWVSIIRT